MLRTTRTVALLVAALVLILSNGTPAAVARPSQSQGAPASRNINGFNVEGRFLEVWNRPGSEQASVYVNGLPLTNRRAEPSTADGRSYDTQWFERARYEAHPEYAPPNDVLLGRLGAELAEGRGVLDPATRRVRHVADLPFAPIDKPDDADGTRKVWFPETRHTITGKILEYWLRYGGLAQFGYPLSEPFREVSRADGKEYDVQYFERNRFELHPEKKAPYEVELGLLGAQQYRYAPVPASALPIAPPQEVISARDSMVVAMSQMPANLVPDFGSTYASRLVSRPLFLEVIARDTLDNAYPELAWYVPTLENGGAYFAGSGADRHLIVKVKLRPQIAWADGAEVTARDILFHHKLMLDARVPAVSALRSVHLKVSTIEAADPYTLLVRFLTYQQASSLMADPVNGRRYAHLRPFVDERRPVTDTNYNVVLGALPEHVLGQMPPEQISRSPFMFQPVGNGPYMVQNAEWQGTNSVVLVPNPKYNLTAPPILRRITFRATADAVQAARQVAAGEIDAAARDIFSVPDSLQIYASALDSVTQGGHTLVTSPSRTGDFVIFNLGRTAFSDKRVRQAFAHAINRQGLVDRYWFGKTHVLTSYVPPPVWASPAHPQRAAVPNAAFPAKDYPYDPERAAKLMDEVGYTKERDGYRYRNGARLIVEISHVSRPAGRRVTDITSLQDDLKALGVEVRLKAVPLAGYTGPEGYLTNGQHDLGLITLSPGPDPLDALAPYTTSNIPSDDNGQRGTNFSGFTNARFDELWRLASRETGRGALEPIYAEMQSILSEEVPVVPLAAHPVIEASNRYLSGWQASGNDVPATFRAATFYFRFP